MKQLFIIIVLAFTMVTCRTSGKLLPGIYKSHQGDTLKIFDDNTFRAELKDPDTVNLHQVKYSGGRWNVKKNKLYLTPATKSMGNYWSCMPLKVGMNRLKRPEGCLEKKGDALVFNKLVLKRKQSTRKYRNQ